MDSRIGFKLVTCSKIGSITRLCSPPYEIKTCKKIYKSTKKTPQKTKIKKYSKEYLYKLKLEMMHAHT